MWCFLCYKQVVAVPVRSQILLSCAFPTVCVTVLVFSLLVSCLVNASSGINHTFHFLSLCSFSPFLIALVSFSSFSLTLPPLCVCLLFFVFLDSYLCSPQASGLNFFWVFVFVFSLFCVSPPVCFCKFCHLLFGLLGILWITAYFIKAHLLSCYLPPSLCLAFGVTFFIGLCSYYPTHLRTCNCEKDL